jgi:hypothetical protein
MYVNTTLIPIFGIKVVFGVLTPIVPRMDVRHSLKKGMLFMRYTSLLKLFAQLMEPNLLKLANFICLGYPDTPQKVDPCFYEIKRKTLYHDLLSLIISQRISFKVSRAIRKKLLDICYTHNKNKRNVRGVEECDADSLEPDPVYDPNVIKDLDLKSYGISNPKVTKCIEHVTALALANNLSMNELKDIPGIGDWTYKGLLIMGHGDSSTCSNSIFLSEDAWIRKRLSELVDDPRISKSIVAANILIDRFTNYLLDTNNEKLDKSKLSRFLWRIKDSGIQKIRNNSNLSREDFL